MINNENIKAGFVLFKEGKKFLVLKVNQKTFYAIEVDEKSDKRTLLDKFQTKMKSYKMDDYCRDTGTFVSKFEERYIICSPDEFIIPTKVIKERKMGVSACCGHAAVKSFKRKKHTGRTQCRECGKPLNTIKLEPENWLSFSQDRVIYQVQMDNGDIRVLRRMGEENEKVQLQETN